MDSAASPATRQRLIDAGLQLLLERGYHGVGIQAVLDAAHAPKGSFYHHFRDKEDFALQVLDAYMTGVHAALDASLAVVEQTPVDQVRGFFGMVIGSYATEGYLGCLIGGLGQELSGVSPLFAQRIEECLAYIGGRLADALREATAIGQLPAGTDADVLARRLVDCWEGAALRSRLERDPAPLQDMLDFFFATVTASAPLERST